MKRTVQNSRKKIVYEFHLGEIINKFISDNKLNLLDISKELGITKVGLMAKLDTPYFGTGNDIAQISKACQHNFFESYLTWLNEKGISSSDRVAALEKELAAEKEKAAQLEKLLEQLQWLNTYLKTDIEKTK